MLPLYIRILYNIIQFVMFVLNELRDLFVRPFEYVIMYSE